MSNDLERINELLRQVIDPELGINILDLGLIYTINYNGDERTLVIEMTLTSPGCPMGDMIMENVYQRLAGVYYGFAIDVQLVWEPAWSPEKLTPQGKLFLNRV